MKSNKKYKALVIFIIFLVLIDIVLLIFFISNPSSSEKRIRSRDQNGMATVLEKEVDFSKSQIDQYLQLRSQQRTQGKPLFDSLRKSKENFYALLEQSSVADSIRNNFADRIAATQKQLDLQMFNYFQEVRKICTPQQLPQFDSVIKKTVIKMIGGNRGRTENNKKSPHN
jgi:Spy/CpxP family protein refolding chaperone